GLETTFDVFKRLAGEQVAFQPDIAVAAVQNQGIDQGVDDEIVFLVGRTQEIASIADMHGHPFVVIRLVRMIFFSQLQNSPINFHRIDVLGPPLESPANIIAGAGADNKYILERLAARIAIEQVRQSISCTLRNAGVPREHLLMADEVNRDDAIVSPSTRLD